MSSINKSNSPFKPRVQTPILNFSSDMDSRTNNEVLNIDPNSTGFTFNYLQNADLYNTKALSARLGSASICANVSENNSVFEEYNFPNNITGNGTAPIQDFFEGNFYDRIGTLIISPGQNIYQASFDTTFNVSKSLYPTTPPTGVSISTYTNMYLVNTTGTNTPGVMINSSGSWNIALSGNWTGSVFPALVEPPSTQMNFFAPPNYLAQTTSQIITPAWTGNGSNWTYTTTTNYEFDPPVYLKSGNVYALIPTYTVSNIAFSQISMNVNCVIIPYSGVDLAPNVAAAHLFLNYATTPIQNFALEPAAGGGKAIPHQEINKYVSPVYMSVDNPTASLNRYAPLVSGVQPYYEYAGPVLVYEQYAVNQIEVRLPPNGGQPFNPAKPQWANLSGIAQYTGPIQGYTGFVSPQTTSFGQVLTVPSGDQYIYGAYFYANSQSGTSNAANTLGMWSNNGVQLNPSGYTLGYTITLNEITSTAGSQTAGTFSCTAEPISIFSGTYTFNNPVLQQTTMFDDPTNQLEKLQAVFNQPVLANSGSQYLLSFNFYNPITGGPCTDYNLYNSPVSQYTQYYFNAPVTVGVDQNNLYSGCIVINNNGDGVTYQQNAQPHNINQDELTCGLVFVPSGIGITSIYNYELETNRTQKIITTQADKLLAANYNSCEWYTLLTGTHVNNNLKWTHTSYQGQLLSHQYGSGITTLVGGSGGAIWDMEYIAPSGYQSMQLHGLQPQVTISGSNQHINYTGISLSGNYYYPSITSGTQCQILLATQLESGGIRSSQQYTYSGTGILPGSGGSISLTGIDIFNPNGIPGVSTQWSLEDVIPGNATYVFATQPISGTVVPGDQLYYLAGLVDHSGNQLPNPIPNMNTWNHSSGGMYIVDLTSDGLTQQMPQVTQYQQSYFTEQVPTPTFKKMVVYKDYVIGVGDENNPSYLWYSQQLTSNIWGTDGVEAGYVAIDLNADNNRMGASPITGLEVWKDFLYVFKYNATYRLSYTSNNIEPFQVTQISNTVGSLGFFSTVTTDQGIFGLGQFGPFLAGYYSCDTIGDEILPYYSQLDHTNLTFSEAIYDRERQQIYWSINSDLDSPSANIGLCFSFAEKKWNIRQGQIWNAAGIISDPDGFNQLYVGNVMGQISAISQGSTDNEVLFVDGNGTALNNPITMVAETTWYNLNESQNLKRLIDLRFNCATSNRTLQCDVYYDQSTVPQYTQYMAMNNSVVQRVIHLGGRACRTVKFVFTTVGQADAVTINSMVVVYQDLGRSAIA